MTWRGYYINLKRSPARRQHIEHEIKRFGLLSLYSRFEAIDGNTVPKVSPLSKAEVGIYQSHLHLLEMAAESTEVTHIIEDDVVFSSLMTPMIQQLVNSSALEQFDIIFTDTSIPLSSTALLWFQRSFLATQRHENSSKGTTNVSLMNLNDRYVYGTTSYVVGPLGARKLLPLAQQEFTEGPNVPYDRMIAKVVRAGLVNVGCLMPFVTWLNMKHADASTAERDDEIRVGQTVQRLLRHMFFADRDIRNYLIPALDDVVTSSDYPRLPPYGKHAVRFARTLLALHYSSSNSR